MFVLDVKNPSGSWVTLTGNESDYAVINVTGLNPPPAQINLTNLAMQDGSLFNSSKVATRNIVITIALTFNHETNRYIITDFFRVKEKCSMIFRTDSRQAIIEGYVESVEVNAFSEAEEIQISVICPFPWFRDVAQSGTHTEVLYGDAEPLTVVNPSELPVGAAFRCTFSTNATYLQIQNITTGEALNLNYNFLAGDIVTIDTASGSRTVELTRGGNTSSVFSALSIGSKFLQIPMGSSQLECASDDEDVEGLITYTNLYRGL